MTCGHFLKCCIIDEPCSEEKRFLVFGSHCSLAGVLHKEIYEFNFTANLVNLKEGSIAITLPVGGQIVEVSNSRQSSHFECLVSEALYIALDMLNTELLLALIAVVDISSAVKTQSSDCNQMSSVQLLCEEFGLSILHSFTLGKGTNQVSQRFTTFTPF